LSVSGRLVLLDGFDLGLFLVIRSFVLGRARTANRTGFSFAPQRPSSECDLLGSLDKFLVERQRRSLRGNNLLVIALRGLFTESSRNLFSILWRTCFNISKTSPSFIRQSAHLLSSVVLFIRLDSLGNFLR
jgi:hypothetical protein